jgi:hypothetical protein
MDNQLEEPWHLHLCLEQYNLSLMLALKISGIDFLTLATFLSKE